MHVVIVTDLLIRELVSLQFDVLLRKPEKAAEIIVQENDDEPIKEQQKTSKKRKQELGQKIN